MHGDISHQKLIESIQFVNKFFHNIPRGSIAYLNINITIIIIMIISMQRAMAVVAVPKWVVTLWARMSYELYFEYYTFEIYISTWTFYSPICSNQIIIFITIISIIYIYKYYINNIIYIILICIHILRNGICWHFEWNFMLSSSQEGSSFCI